MNSHKLICGVDVSKDTLDLYFNDPLGKETHLQIPNDRKNHLQALRKLGTERTYIMESTGPYYLSFAFLLRQKGVDVRVENPITIKRYIQMNLERNKTDKKDARWIYRYGVERGGTPWELPSETALKCSQIIGLIDLYIRQTTQLSNQLHSLEQLPVVDTSIVRNIRKMHKRITSEINVLETKLSTMLIEWHGDQMKRLSSIPGLGKRAVALLIVHTNGFKKVQNYRQLIALAGLAPKERSSGTSLKSRKRICKMGNGYLRNVLYMCSLSAIKYNIACKDLYQRLKAKGKNGKVALIAVCNKLLKQAFAIATNGTIYRPDLKLN